MAYIVIAYIDMASMFMAYIFMAYIVMAVRQVYPSLSIMCKVMHTDLCCAYVAQRWRAIARGGLMSIIHPSAVGDGRYIADIETER